MFQIKKFKLRSSVLIVLFSLLPTLAISDVDVVTNGQEKNNVSGGLSMGFSVMQTMRKVHQQQLGILPTPHSQQTITELEQRLTRVETILNKLIEQQVK